MNCRTCAHCAIINRLSGYCHGAPPEAYFMRWFATESSTGSDRIVLVHNAQALIPSYLASTYPPVNPNNRGCRLHRLSLLTWFRWRFGKQREVPSPVEQEKLNG